MIDYIHVVSYQKPGRPFYKYWKSSTNTEGHTTYKRIGHGLHKVTYCPNTGETRIKGSIHKLYSFVFEGLKNANYTQFTRSKLVDAIHHIEAFTGIEATSFKIKSYEFGLNVIIQMIVRNLLSKNVIDFKAYSNKDHREKSYYYLNFKKDAKEHKFYDKGMDARQQGYNKTGENILRIETKLNTYREANKMGVYNLQDLTDLDVWDNQFQALKDQLNKLIILDNPKDYPEYNNPKVFEEWRNKKGATNRKRRQRFFDRLPHSKIKEIVSKEMEKTYFNLSRKPPIVEYVNVTYCLITGIDISHQKKTSKFVSESTILSLPQDQYNKLEREFLPLRHIEEDKAIKSYYIAHNVRNRYNDTKRRLERDKNNGLVPLFELSEMISPAAV